ncbi:phosphatase PAP2 family protein [Nonlabens antarcticus]|uniref:phosphatase PAP2 family protein n=1 Tax=Nonlabens antarcticus TaxID=392714 RepID=UPI0018919C49|nr:phosphatase PAP2 family protein [Nonlabens antarcticus]
MKNELKSIIKKCIHFLSRKYSKYDNKLPYLITSAVAFLIVAGATKLFIELTENLKSDLLARLDRNITNYVASYRTPALDTYFVTVTNIGDALGYLVVFISCTVIFYLVFKNWKYVVQLALVLLLTLCSNLLLKKVINRARPSIEHLVAVETLSYPSGHAMTAMAFYGFLIYLISTFKLNLFIKTGIIIILSILIISIGISRIYLGVHFPSDIAAGFIAGFVWVVLCILMLNLLRVFREDPNT